MCSSQNEELIGDVVDEFVDDDKAFTAFEVSVEVQKRAKDKGLSCERHRNMRGVIHGAIKRYVDSGLYSQSLEDVGAPSKAFVYYPDGYDLKNYEPLSRNNSTDSTNQSTISSSSPANSIAPVVSSDGDSDDGDGIDVGKTGDARGTVAVSAHVVRASGFAQGDVAYACPDVRNGQNVLVLAKQIPNGLSKQTTYTVDHGNNIRITSYALDKANVDGSKGYDFYSENDRIVVKSHA